MPLLSSDVLCEGDRIDIFLDHADAGEECLSGIVPNPALPLSICFENEHFLILNKPFGMPTHPSHDHYQDTLANALAAYPHFRSLGQTFRPVNRLDRNTSGAVLVAKNRLASAQLSASMQAGNILKYYLALTETRLPADSGEIRTDIRRAEASIITRTDRPFQSGEPDAQTAVTRYRKICERGSVCSYLVRPLTGRTHQIRVHFASLGCPLLGDDLYGNPSDLFPHQALHSLFLSVPDIALLKREERHILSVFAPPPDSILHLAGVSEEELQCLFRERSSSSETFF